MAKRTNQIALIVAATIGTVAISSPEAQSQGRGGRGGGGGRSGGHSAPNIQRPSQAGPAVSRPANSTPMRGNIGAGNVSPGNIGAGNVQRPNTAGNPRPNIGTQGITKPDGGFQRPNVGNVNNSNLPNKPNIAGNLPGKVDPPKLGGNLPGTSGKPNLPNIAGRPNNPPSSSQLNDFLGMGNRPNGGEFKPGAGKPDLGKVDLGKPGNGNDRLPNLNNVDRTNIGKNESTNIGNRIGNTNNTNNINVGNVNVGNSLDFSKDQKAWIDNRHLTGDQVRVNAGNRYAGIYANGAYRHGMVGGYPYYNGWHTHGAFYGWQPVGYVALGTFLGASWANTQPVYYAYGTGGNVYYENNVVYVDGQASGTPTEYAAQSAALVAAAPEQSDEVEWLPLGTFAFTQEGVDDSQAMIELAVSKAGVLAGTYYNEATQVSRSLKGTIDKTTQRAAFGFADGKNTGLVVETGVQNLTQDEAPALLHNGADQSTPVLLVRLQPPADSVSN